MSSEWPTFMLSECVELATGFPFKSAEYVEAAAAVRLLRGDNIGQGQVRWDGVKRWLRKDGDSLDSYELRENDLVLAMDRPWISAGLKFARVRKADVPALLVQRVARLRPLVGVDVDYLHAVVASPQFTQHIQTVTTGTAVPHISGKQIQEYEFKLPDLVTQRAIGGLLMLLDDRITVLRETNATLEAIAQALFKSWFVDFDPVRAKMEGRAPEGMDEATAALFPDGFEESELGPVPRGWQVLPFLEICELQGGSQPPASTFIDHEREKYVRLLQIRDYSTDAHKTYIPDALKLKKVSEDDVLIGRYGSASGDKAKDSLGRVCRGLTGTYNVALMKVCPIKVGREFAFQMVSDKAFYNYLQGVSSKAVQAGFSKNELGQYKVVLPSHEIAERFEAVGEAVWTRVKAGVAMHRQITTLRDTLLPRLISGQLRLPQVQAQIEERTP